jgi:hypothetical protein
MDFTRPNYLYLLILIPFAALLLARAARRKRADVARLGTPALIAALSASDAGRPPCGSSRWLP